MMEERGTRIAALLEHFRGRLEGLTPLVDLIARIYVARSFWLAGWSKITDWSSTLYLFNEEYQVPLLPPALAAVFGTAGELGFSLLLLAGLFTQLSAFGLFFVNFVAVISYYSSLADSPAALHDHMEWGIILAGLMVTRSHPWGVERLLRERFPFLGR